MGRNVGSATFPPQRERESINNYKAREKTIKKYALTSDPRNEKTRKNEIYSNIY